MFSSNQALLLRPFCCINIEQITWAQWTGGHVEESVAGLKCLIEPEMNEVYQRITEYNSALHLLHEPTTDCTDNDNNGQHKRSPKVQPEHLDWPTCWAAV